MARSGGYPPCSRPCNTLAGLVNPGRVQLPRPRRPRRPRRSWRTRSSRGSWWSWCPGRWCSSRRRRPWRWLWRRRWRRWWHDDAAASLAPGDTDDGAAGRSHGRSAWAVGGPRVAAASTWHNASPGNASGAAGSPAAAHADPSHPGGADDAARTDEPGSARGANVRSGKRPGARGEERHP